MKFIKLKPLIRHICISLSLFCLLPTTYAAYPLWTFTPNPSYPPNLSINATQTAIVFYTVQNQSHKAKSLIIESTPGIVQSLPCKLSPIGQPGSSCALVLAVTGNALPKEGIHTGPILCEANSNGTPNANQCYRPSAADNLNITLTPSPVGVTISVNPLILPMAESAIGTVTVTNSTNSSTTANNVVATIPSGSGISVQSTTCGTSLAIGASCTITFATTTQVGPTTIPVSGTNTNTVNVVASVNPTIITVSPFILVLAEHSTGTVTVTNSNSSATPANNVVATIPSGSGISVQSTTCGTSLAIGASCTITFATTTQVGPTTIPVSGTNTNTANVYVAVTDQPVISITGPVQQSRIIPTNGISSLNLQVTNDSNSLFYANNITVIDKTSCPNLMIDASNCISLAPGATCALALSTTTPYAPCTITVSGSNTGNSPTTLIAFSNLGGLVFQTNGANGKVVIDAASEFTSEWTSPSTTGIPGAFSDDDGVRNTDAIVVNSACTNQTGNCAAYRCRAISADWYLPAKNELQAVIFALCPGSSYPCAFGSLISRFYWSSTQWFADTNAYAVDVPDGNFGPSGKSSSQPVRCIRDF